MATRSFARFLNTTLLSVILMLTIGDAAMAAAQGENGSKGMEGSVVTPYETESPAIPPIDAAAPLSLETASFGLG